MDRRPAPPAAGLTGLRVGPDLTLGARPVAARSNIPRDAGLDALRASLTLLVLFHHASITYGASGDWYYTEVRAGHDPSSLLLSLFTGFNQAFFMGLFFLLAGYFTPRAVERHGTAAYMGERALRALAPGVARLAPASFPSNATLALAALGTGAAAFLLRLVWPTGATLIHLQLGYFASYVVLFSAGCLAAPGRASTSRRRRSGACGS
jgi:peptidoglycan/LPS O-acetylase OafA/YrhL